MNTQTVNRIEKEISSLISAGYNESDIYVSVNEQGEAVWGEATALHADQMWDAMEAAGFEAQEAVDAMIDAQSFVEKYSIPSEV